MDDMLRVPSPAAQPGKPDTRAGLAKCRRSAALSIARELLDPFLGVDLLS